MNKQIGIIDSGVGGLTVLKSLYEKMPNENYVYIGDNKYCPYGDKSKEELYTIAKRIINYFEEIDVKLIVVACNTISSTILDDLKKETSIPMIGVVFSTVQLFLKQNINQVLIIGTDGTISSKAYERKIKEKNDIEVISLKTPLLVPLIEKNEDVSEVLNLYLGNYKNIKSIILGCTHYKLIEDKISDILSCPIINSSDGIVFDVYKFLNDNNLLNNGSGSLKIYTTGDIENFKVISERIFGDVKVNYINL